MDISKSFHRNPISVAYDPAHPSVCELITRCLMQNTILAGMPVPMWVLTEAGQARLSSISFFLMGLLLSALVVRWMWNWLQADFPKLPRLTYGKSLAMVTLWGLCFILVLTMISGARELLTPGAWKVNGATYALADVGSAKSAATPNADDERLPERTKKLDALRFALWQFAATHEGRFPTDAEAAKMPDSIWEVADPSAMRFVYVPGLTVQSRELLLVAEPELFGPERLVLWTNGQITTQRVVSEPGPLVSEAKP